MIVWWNRANLKTMNDEKKKSRVVTSHRSDAITIKNTYAIHFTLFRDRLCFEYLPLESRHVWETTISIVLDAWYIMIPAMIF